MRPEVKTLSTLNNVHVVFEEGMKHCLEPTLFDS